MPPVFGPSSPSRTVLWSSDDGSSASRSPSHSAIIDTSRPVRRSSITTRAPAAPNAPSLSMRRTAALASAFVVGDHHALARGEAVGLDHHVARAARR